MFAAPDVYGSQAALANLLPHLQDNARVVVFEGKLANHRLGKFFNPLLKTLKLTFSTTPRPDYEPWRLLAEHVDRVEVRDYFLGLMFLFSASTVRDV